MHRLVDPDSFGFRRHRSVAHAARRDGSPRRRRRHRAHRRRGAGARPCGARRSGAAERARRAHGSGADDAERLCRPARSARPGDAHHRSGRSPRQAGRADAGGRSRAATIRAIAADIRAEASQSVPPEDWDRALQILKTRPRQPVAGTHGRQGCGMSAAAARNSLEAADERDTRRRDLRDARRRRADLAGAVHAGNAGDRARLRHHRSGGQADAVAVFCRLRLRAAGLRPLSDGFGRKPITIAFMSIYLAASIAALLSRNIEMLIAARFLQGVGAAAGIAISRAVVRDLFTGERSARIMNLVGLILAIGPAHLADARRHHHAIVRLACDLSVHAGDGRRHHPDGALRPGGDGAARPFANSPGGTAGFLRDAARQPAFSHAPRWSSPGRPAPSTRRPPCCRSS